MNLSDLWFFLICVLFCGFFFLEGFDFGVGVLVKFIGKNDLEKRAVINSIGPVWDANEVWLLTAGGAIFAAFPGWYASMFSGFYFALFLLLAALIIRGVSFEFRSKVDSPSWRNTWDTLLMIGSALPPILLGVAMSDLIYGLPLNADHDFTGSFFDLLPLPSVAVGVALFVFILYHGSVFLSLKLEDGMDQRAFSAGKKLGIVTIVLGVLVIILAATTTDLFKSGLAIALAALSLLSVVLSYYFVLKKNGKLSIILNSITVVTGVSTLFAGLYPRVMVSSTDAANSLTVTNASSTPYTLTVMTVVACTVLPIVLGYSIWNYWVFRKRVSAKKHLEY